MHETMAGGISIHAVDVSRGVPAAGLRIEVFAAGTIRHLVCDGVVNTRGTLDAPILTSDAIRPGYYEAVFHVEDYYRDCNVELSEHPFLDMIVFRFGLSDASRHLHLPMKFTPWGYTCFLGA
jgi:5-hydroxyisourate hydrolase